jgi:hypothetical protein
MSTTGIFQADPSLFNPLMRVETYDVPSLERDSIRYALDDPDLLPPFTSDTAYRIFISEDNQTNLRATLRSMDLVPPKNLTDFMNEVFNTSDEVNHNQAGSMLCYTNIEKQDPDRIVSDLNSRVVTNVQLIYPTSIYDAEYYRFVMSNHGTHLARGVEATHLPQVVYTPMQKSLPVPFVDRFL